MSAVNLKLNRFTFYFLLVLALLCAPIAFGQGAYVPARSVNSNVNGVLRPVAGATITVCAAGNANVPCAPPLAGVLFKDQALTQPLANPTTTDLNGNYPTMALAAGNYTITETAVGFTGFSYQITITCGVGSCAVSGLSLNNTTLTGTTTASAVNISGTGTYSGTSKYSGAALFGAGPIFDVTAPPFNADPTGAADSTVAIQSAITTAAGRPVYLPAGTYKTSADLTSINCQNGQSPGVKIYGDGQYKTIINPTHANGWTIRLEGTCAAFFGSPNFQFNSYIGYLSIAPTSPGANTGGIKMTGQWFWLIDHVRISGTTSDGIQMPIRTDIQATNPDNYGNNYGAILNSDINRNSGWGIDQQDGPEGLMTVSGNNVILNGQGGMFLTGEADTVKNNSFSQNGQTNNALTTCINPQAPGVLVDAGPQGSPDSLAMENNEFDSNCYVNVWIRRGLGLRITNSRMLSHVNSVAQDGILRPRVHVRLDGLNAVQSFVLGEERHRGDFGGLNDQNMTLYQIVPGGGNVSGGKIEDAFVAVGNISANTTTYSVAGGAIATVSISGGVVQNTAVVKDGGAGYTNTPSCSFAGGGGTLATCTAATTKGVVQVLETAPGSGYTGGATVAFSGGGCAVAATGSVTVTNGGVSFIGLLTPGSGCASAPTCTINPVGAGSGATCSTSVANIVSGVTVTAGGSGYTTAPSVVITPAAADSGLTAFSFGVTQSDIYDRTTNQIYLNVPSINLPLTSAGVMKWSTDTGLSRGVAGQIDFGNGAQGDISGSFRANSATISGGAGAVNLANNTVQFSESTCPANSTGFDLICGNSTTHTIQASYNNGSFLNIPQVIANGTATMTTAAIGAGACGTTVTVSASGVATTDTITWAFTAAPVGSNAGIVAWPTANNVNFAYCPGVAETPAAASVIWRVLR